MVTFKTPVELALSHMVVARCVESQQEHLISEIRKIEEKLIDVPQFTARNEPAKFGRLPIEQLARELLRDYRSRVFVSMMGTHYYHPLVLNLCRQRFGEDRVEVGDSVDFLLRTRRQLYHVRQRPRRPDSAHYAQYVRKPDCCAVRLVCHEKKMPEPPTNNRPYWVLYGADTWWFICGDNDPFYHHQVACFEQNDEYLDAIQSFLYDLDEAAQVLLDGWRRHSLVRVGPLGEELIDTEAWDDLANDRYITWEEEVDGQPAAAAAE